MLNLGFLLLAPLAQAPSEGFRAGDLVVYDPAETGAEVVNIFDPVDGTKRSPGYSISTAFNGVDTLCWDRHRARLIFTRIVAGDTQLVAGDSAGLLEVLVDFPAPQFPELVAPAGDGRIFYRDRNNGLPGSVSLLRPDGTTTFLLDSTTGLIASGVTAGRQMEYHAKTDSLIILTNENFENCEPGVTGIGIRRIQLDSSTESVVGQVQCVTTNLTSPVPFGTDKSIGLQAIDEDSYLVTIFAQDQTVLPRLLRLQIDASAPASNSLSVEVFSNTDESTYSGGTWSSTLGKAVTVNYFFDRIDAYGENDTFGSLVTFEDILGNNSQIIQISTVSPGGLQASGKSFVSQVTGGRQDLEVDFGPSASGDLYIVTGTTAGFSPYTTVNGIEIPIAYSAYTLLTFIQANSTIFVDSVGVLDGSGLATAAVDLPAGLPAVLVGADLHHVALRIDPVSGNVLAASNPVALSVTP